ncbi:3'-5' exonuclease [bacterium]|nr:MAG: 3'-5' exonuclease [bacterium]
MRLSLKRSLVFFDVETTGLNVQTDRIIQISTVKFVPGREQPNVCTVLMNPGIPIPPEATAIHHITNEQVKKLPGFPAFAMDLEEIFTSSDVGGYNVARFDLPILAEEFRRCNIAFPAPGTKIVDVQSLFFLKEPRTLSAAVKFYCGKEHAGAHDAEADVRAAVAVLESQLERYQELCGTVDELHSLCFPEELVDFGGKLKKNGRGQTVWAFGKNRGKVVKDDPDYAKWVMKSDFPPDTKRIIDEILRGKRE